MNTHDKFELPPLPYPNGVISNDAQNAEKMYTEGTLRKYARAAIEADRKRRGEPVARVNDDGFIVETGLGLAPGTLLYTAQQPDDETTARIGAWLSAALDDPAVCQEMKGDIREWFKAGQPNVQPTVTATLQDAELIADDRNVDMALAFFAETPIKRQAIEVVQAVMQAVSKELWLNPMGGSQPADPDGTLIGEGTKSDDPVGGEYPSNEWVTAFFGSPDDSGFYYFRGDFGNIAHRYKNSAKHLLPQSADPVVKESLTVPDGWQLVPIKPTEAMLNQGESEWSSRYEANRGYRAMLQAAPNGPDSPKLLGEMSKAELIDLIEQQQQELDAIGAGGVSGKLMS